MTRTLLYGAFMVGLHLSGGYAQTVATAADSPVAPRTAAIDGGPKVGTNVPEIVRQPEADRHAVQPRTIADPKSVLKPPTIDLQFLRAIRLDWDQLGTTSSISLR